ncbi:MAG: DUF4364 family protein [Oscillospiraceae bacterium]
MVIFISDAFANGIRLGGLTNITDIKIIICYILDSVNSELSKDQISQILQEEEIANYFDIITSINELCEHKHIINKNDKFYISNLGKSTYTDLISTIPTSIKDRSLQSSHKNVLLHKKLKDNKVDIIKNDDGYTIECKILDFGSDLLNINLFVGTIEQAQKIKEKFLKDPTCFYHNILNFLI